jgi:spore germination cell wall hydrolase CwlJ-like protein
VSALDGRRLAVPAGVLACATVLGLLVEAGSRSAADHHGARSAAASRPVPAAFFWDEPSYPRPTATRGARRGGPAEPASGEIDLGTAAKIGSDTRPSRAPVFVPAVTARAATARAAARLKSVKARQLEEELNCLALNIYFEARNEPSEGQAAVGHVVLNRVSDPRFPDTVCKVVRQGGEQVRHRCQFSWWCDGQSDRPKNREVWEMSKAIAGDVYWGRWADPTNGALWYHADYVMPRWGRVLERGPKIGRHIFYLGRKQRTQVAANQ